MKEIGQPKGDFDSWDTMFLNDMPCFIDGYFSDLKPFTQQIYLQLYNL